MTVAAINSRGTGTFSSPAVQVTPRATDTAAPTVTGRSPALSLTAVGQTANVLVTFNEQVQGVNNTTFRLRDNTTQAIVTAAVRAGTVANQWVLEQILMTGVTGVMLCHVRNAEAARAFVAAARYPFNRPEVKGLDKVLPEGMRGSGGQANPARIWGISPTEYMERADPWPMNPRGELTLSVKMEDKYALENVDEITKVPGIAWGEWGPGDQSMSLMGLEFLKRGGGQGRSTPYTKATGGLPPAGDPKLDAARAAGGGELAVLDRHVAAGLGGLAYRVRRDDHRLGQLHSADR